MNQNTIEIKVHHQILKGIGRKYLRTALFLVIALLLLYFLQGPGTFLIFLVFVILFIFYLAWRGNWLFEINAKGIISGSMQRREQISWGDLHVILIELDQQQIYLKSGENSRLINFQLIPKDESIKVIETLHKYADVHGISLQEKRGFKKR